MELLHKGMSHIETYKLITEEKYVHYIYHSSGGGTDGKVIIVHIKEREDSECTVHEIPVDAYPDVVEIIPLKHEYHIVLVYDVWGKIKKVTE